MRVFITGVGCVGKTTVGQKLATLLGCPFFDLDAEIESYFGTVGKHGQKKRNLFSFFNATRQKT